MFILLCLRQHSLGLYRKNSKVEPLLRDPIKDFLSVIEEEKTALAPVGFELGTSRTFNGGVITLIPFATPGDEGLSALPGRRPPHQH